MQKNNAGTAGCTLHLITGGSGSGKSEYAERLVTEAAGDEKRIYIATMIPEGEDGRQRVLRHHELRRERCFETVECYTGLARLQIPCGSTVLLECVSNLVANEMFEPEGAHEDTAGAVLEGIRCLRGQAGRLFLVTNEVFSDGNSYDAETMRYLSYLGAVNRALAAMAEEVTEVVCGIPVPVKGPGKKAG